jgi:LmbE family N-acetylglucosaminyl deacetylase
MAKTVLALVPHPDDAEYFAGGLLARFVEEGSTVYLVVSTDGCCGSFEFGKQELIAIRAEESKRAAEVLGAQPPILLGYPDFELDCLPAGVLREKFIRQIRTIRPDVVVAEDPYAIVEPHPDHRQVAWAASDAIEYAALPLVHPEHLKDGLEPYFVPEKYFYAENNPRANKVIDISATFEKKIAALAQHKSQIVFLVEGLYRQARQAGVDIGAALGEGASDPLTAFTWGMKTEAAQVGEKAGYLYGEAFRYERYHPFVEMILASQSEEA